MSVAIASPYARSGRARGASESPGRLPDVPSRRGRSRVDSAASQNIVPPAGAAQNRRMETTGRAAARDAAGRETVDAFRAHHFAGLGCCRRAGRACR